MLHLGEQDLGARLLQHKGCTVLRQAWVQRQVCAACSNDSTRVRLTGKCYCQQWARLRIVRAGVRESPVGCLASAHLL